jgi:hypothetical protein
LKDLEDKKSKVNAVAEAYNKYMQSQNYVMGYEMRQTGKETLETTKKMEIEFAKKLDDNQRSIEANARSKLLWHMFNKH